MGQRAFTVKGLAHALTHPFCSMSPLRSSSFLSFAAPAPWLAFKHRPGADAPQQLGKACRIRLLLVCIDCTVAPSPCTACTGVFHALVMPGGTPQRRCTAIESVPWSA